jgi:hypothetical protein
MLLGPGAIYKGFINPSSPGTLIGATLGGSTITIERQYYTPEIDGMLGPLEGTERLIQEIPRINTRIVEVNKETLMIALPGTSATTSGTNHDKITSAGSVSAGNYQDIAIVADLSNKANPIVFVCKNALSTEPLEVATGTGKDDVAFAVTFTGHYDTTTPQTPPYEIYTPKS